MYHRYIIEIIFLHNIISELVKFVVYVKDIDKMLIMVGKYG